MTWDPILARPKLPVWPPTHHEMLPFVFRAALHISREKDCRVSVKVAGRHWRTGDPQWRLDLIQAPGPSSRVES